MGFDLEGDGGPLGKGGAVADGEGDTIGQVLYVERPIYKKYWHWPVFFVRGRGVRSNVVVLTTIMYLASALIIITGEVLGWVRLACLCCCRWGGWVGLGWVGLLLTCQACVDSA